MFHYTIIAIVFKIESEKIFIKGLGKSLCYSEKGQAFNNFEQKNEKDDIINLISKPTTDHVFELKDFGPATCAAFYRELLVRSMIERKPLKFNLDLDNKKLISIELSDV